MNPGQPPAIEFRNVSISFDGAPALRNISFTLPRGEMICITGDSDSGKSVLLRLALGFLQPDEGQIWINGRETTAMEEDDLLAVDDPWRQNQKTRRLADLKTIAA
jgi:ABC-type multidrug transport system fused ATPase/permease subunit